MYTETVTLYEKEDFEKMEDEMTIDKAIETLENITSHFPYDEPTDTRPVRRLDLEHYEIVFAINMAISALEMIKLQ